MEFADIMSAAREALTVKRVFGDPIEREGVTVIPVAHVFGGGGGGGGGDDKGSGSGGGWGGFARPAGVYVIRGTDVHWEPALDVTSLILGAQKVLMLLLRLAFGKRKRRSRR